LTIFAIRKFGFSVCQEIICGKKKTRVVVIKKRERERERERERITSSKYIITLLKIMRTNFLIYNCSSQKIYLRNWSKNLP